MSFGFLKTKMIFPPFAKCSSGSRCGWRCDAKILFSESRKDGSLSGISSKYGEIEDILLKSPSYKRKCKMLVIQCVPEMK